MTSFMLTLFEGFRFKSSSTLLKAKCFCFGVFGVEAVGVGDGIFFFDDGSLHSTEETSIFGGIVFSVSFFGKVLFSASVFGDVLISILSFKFCGGTDDVCIKLFVERRSRLATEFGGFSSRARFPVGTGSGCLTGLTGADADFVG